MLQFLIMPPSSKPTSTASSTATAASVSSAAATKLTGHHHHHQHSNPHSHSPLLLCKHSPSATLDLLILILVLFSGSFLLSSYFSYLFHSLSLLLSPLLSTHSASFSLPFVLGCTLFFATTLISIEFCCGSRSRKCEKPGCKGLKKALAFDLQLQTEDCVKNGSKEIDGLPWKGGSEGNPDYECLRAELRKMAPPNGRAVLLFRARCGCPIAKLEGWGPKRGRRHKKAVASLAQNGDHS